MKNIGLLRVLKEQDEYGGFLSGDFNSNASTQSWGEFFNIYLAFGPVGAIASEMSSWHGERKLKYYKHPYSAFLPEGNNTLPLPENYEINYITGGMKVSDLVEGVQTDEKGEYFNYESLSGGLKFYLPNSQWFTTFYSNMPYKFKTEIGQIYTLLLQLSSNKTNLELQVGADKSNDDMKTSLQNLSPNLGNGWMISPPPDQSGLNFCYFTKVGNNYIPYNVTVLNQSVKSSWQLFWEKWGIVIQIVASIILAAFTLGLSAEIEALFLLLAEMESMVGAAGFFTEISAWVSATGAFAVPRATIMAGVLLESAVNLPAAFIDRSFNNQFGFWLGVAFCFFPLVSQYGKLGKWIKGKYSKEAVDGMLEKMLAYGISESTTQEQLFKFITEELNAEQKLMWSELMNLLAKKEGAEAYKQSVKEAFKNAAKDKLLPSKLASWWKASKTSPILKTLFAAAVYTIDVTKWYMIVEEIKSSNKDPRSVDEIFSDAQSGVDKVKENFITSDDSKIIITKPSDEIIVDYINNLPVNEEGGKLIYTLSKNENEGSTFFIDLVANEKMEEYRVGVKNSEKILNITYKELDEIMDIVFSINQKTSEPKTDEEIFSWFDPEDSNTIILQYISKYSDDLMSNEIGVAVNKYKCLATNFKYVDGYPLLDNKWVLSFEVEKPITIKHDGKNLTLPIGSVIYIFDDGNFTYKNVDYKTFSCL